MTTASTTTNSVTTNSVLVRFFANSPAKNLTTTEWAAADGDRGMR